MSPFLYRTQLRLSRGAIVLFLIRVLQLIDGLKYALCKFSRFTCTLISYTEIPRWSMARRRSCHSEQRRKCVCSFCLAWKCYLQLYSLTDQKLLQQIEYLTDFLYRVFQFLYRNFKRVTLLVCDSSENNILFNVHKLQRFCGIFISLCWISSVCELQS